MHSDVTRHIDTFRRRRLGREERARDAQPSIQRDAGRMRGSEGDDDATVPLVDDTLEGAKAFVKLCKIGVGEDATELKSITPRLLADALPFAHKHALRAALRATPQYPAVGLGKFAREWLGTSSGRRQLLIGL